MNARHLVLTAALVSLAAPAAAVVKVYNSTPPNGTAGDTFLFATTTCPPITPTPGNQQGDHTLTDNAGGTVTYTNRNLVAPNFTDLPPFIAESVFGPGAFVFTQGEVIQTLTTTPTGSGSTAPGGTVTWGIVSGFENSGSLFCVASPQTICTGAVMLPHGLTVPTFPPFSPTYDLGTWTFDAEGDVETSNYINATFTGGTSNQQILLRGSYVGAGIPALPIVGAGALALGLAVAGTRSLLRKK